MLSVAAAAALIVATPPTVASAPAHRPPPEAPQLSERAERVVRDLTTALAAEDWHRAETTLQELASVAYPGSYDVALVDLFCAQLHLARGTAAAAIPAMENVVRSKYFSEEQVLDWTYVLAQLYAQNDQLEQAEVTIEQWLQTTPHPTVAAYVLRVSVGLELAQRDSAAATDRYERLLARTREGLLLGIRPDETLLYLRAACLQGLQRWDESAETLELILKLHPTQRERWQQLLAMYVHAGRDLPALLTLDRAKEQAGLDTPAEDLLRGQFLHALGQDRQALDVWEKGLRRGVENPAPHWILAAYVACTLNDFERAARMVDEAMRLPLTPAEQQSAAALREEIAARIGAG